MIYGCTVLRNRNVKRRMTMTIEKTSIIGDVLDADPTTASFFFDRGMHCLGCPSARGESIEEACEVHGVDADELVKKLNAHVAGK